MANPILNDKALRDAANIGSASGGWAAPDISRGTPIPGTPIHDGPVSSWQSQAMTVSGTATAAGVLFVILLAAAAFGWNAVDVKPGSGFPIWIMGGVIVGFVCALAVRFKPQWAKVLGPLYAVGQGVAVGAISKFYETYQKGIVTMALGVTVAVFGVMLLLYKTNIIKVTDRFRRIVMGATMGIMVFYGISMLLRLFGMNVGFLTGTSAMSIGFSFLVAGLAAFNLALDFDFIERGSQAGLPKQMEWVGAMGLLVTVVWLYLEILRLLSKLDRR
jgi:uncharacterized YccA/Bax inhibitor family protein